MNVVGELEKAASVLMAHPGLVSMEERHGAEQLFLQFRKTEKPYEVCQNILKNCKVEYVLFEAATTLKEAIIREWSLLKKEEVDSLCSFLLQCATERTDYPNFVREQILLVVAVIFKLGTLETPDARTALINGLTNLISSGNRNMDLVCCSIMKALLTEYSTSSQSTNFGMSLDFHAKCKKAFEEKDLLNLFMLTVNTLEKFSNVESLNALTREDVAVFNRYLSLAEQILLWEFMSGNPLSLLRFPTLNETAQKIIFKPHKNWKDVMLNPNLIGLYFKLLRVTLPHNELSHHCLQCITQLASVAGAVFGSDEIQQNYISHLMTCLLSIVDGHRWSPHQALCLANVFFRLVDVCPIKILKNIKEEILRSLFKAMTFLTCTFQEQAVKVGQNDIDDNEYAEASCVLLDAWITVISHAEDFPVDLFKEHGLTIVDTYLKCHLGPPDGIRSEAETNSMDEIDHEIVECDRYAYSDQLSNIGHFARMCLLEVLPVLVQKLSVRNDYLKQLLNHEKQRKHGNSAGAPSTDVLFEDIHWLIIISTYILTIDTTGESDQVPSEIIDCSNKYLTTHPHCVSSSVKFLMSVGKDGNINNVDPSIALFTTILQTAELEMEFLQHNLVHSFSPELCSSILWFLKRFARGYLGGSSSQLKLTPCLNACFDLSNDCGRFVMKSLLDSAEMNLLHWSGEPQVSEDISRLLLRIFSEKKRVGVALSMPNVWSIAKKFSSQDSAIVSLSPKVQRNLVEGLMKACMEVSDERTKEELKAQVLKPIMERYQSVRCAENFKSIAQKEETKFNIVRTFECLRGIFPICFASFSDKLFQYFLPIIEDTVTLLQIYDNYANIINAILEMYVDVAQILSFLSQENTTRLCKICLEMMKMYSKLSNLRKNVTEEEEEDKFYDVLLLIRLLSHILSKDYLNLGEPTPSENADNVCPVDVVLYGFQIVIPLITQELLKYPRLSDEYFKLVTFVCEVYPEKIKTLPPDLFQSFMASIQMAISDFGADTAKCSLDALSSLAKYLHNECDRHDPINSSLLNALQKFLNIVFQHIVLGHFNMELIEPAAESLFLLICCYQEEYLKLANNLIASQHVTDEKFKQRLIEAFQILTPAGLQLTPNRQSLKQFRKNLEVFLQNVKGFLCFK